MKTTEKIIGNRNELDDRFFKNFNALSLDHFLLPHREKRSQEY